MRGARDGGHNRTVGGVQGYYDIYVGDTALACFLGQQPVRIGESTGDHRNGSEAEGNVDIKVSLSLSSFSVCVCVFISCFVSPFIFVVSERH